MEEQLAEAVLSTVRASRGGGQAQRAQRAQNRKQEQQEQRRWLTALAMPRIRAAATRASRARRAAGSTIPAPVMPAYASPPAAAISVVAAPGAEGPSTPPAGILCEAPTKPAPVALATFDLPPPPRAAAADLPNAAAAAPPAAAAGGVSRVKRLPLVISAVDEVVAATAPPTRQRSRRAPASAQADCSGGRVTLDNLQDLLATAAAGNGGSGNSSSDESCSLDSKGTQQSSGSEAGSEVEGPTKGGPSKGLEGGEADGARRVSVGGLFKLMNGVLDV
jgi:hypothetical protein